jgi:hypothetical protein
MSNMRSAFNLKLNNYSPLMPAGNYARQSKCRRRTRLKINGIEEIRSYLHRARSAQQLEQIVNWNSEKAGIRISYLDRFSGCAHCRRNPQPKVDGNAKQVISCGNRPATTVAFPLGRPQDFDDLTATFSNLHKQNVCSRAMTDAEGTVKSPRQMAAPDREYAFIRLVRKLTLTMSTCSRPPRDSHHAATTQAPPRPVIRWRCATVLRPPALNQSLRSRLRPCFIRARTNAIEGKW